MTRLSSREQGGFLREVFLHFVFLHHRLIGKLELIESKVEYRTNLSSESLVIAQYSSNDIPVRLYGSVGGSAPDKNEWTLYGLQNSVQFRDWNTISVGNQEGWKDLLPFNESSIQSQLDEVKKMMEGKPNKLATVREAFEVQEVVEATLKNSDSGQVMD